MKIVKKGLRVYFTIAALFSFIGGYILLSHSNKPAPLQINQPVISSPTTNSASRSFNQNAPSNGFQFLNQNKFNSFSPRLRTGGS
ncbi:MAG: hypothetical protein C3F13_03360 [Anaerolineales bacterium]|nr:hypothetical protein [Anaerolineae bacterium]PWB55723.1 MAG: hypothetical protein C3F13_03360 [Anaerolineales bacterium]